MRSSFALVLLLIASSVHARGQDDDASAGGHGHRVQLSSSRCSLSTPFNVLADSGGIWLYRADGLPREIFFHAGELSVDHQLQQISADDAQRLQAMETQARQLMPQVAAIAHDVIDLSYDALGGVVEVMTGSWLNARKIERLRKRASVYVDDTLGKGRWDQQAFDGNFERYVEQEAEAFKGSIGRHLMWQIMTGVRMGSTNVPKRWMASGMPSSTRERPRSTSRPMHSALRCNHCVVYRTRCSTAIKASRCRC